MPDLGGGKNKTARTYVKKGGEEKRTAPPEGKRVQGGKKGRIRLQSLCHPLLVKEERTEQ